MMTSTRSTVSSSSSLLNHRFPCTLTNNGGKLPFTFSMQVLHPASAAQSPRLPALLGRTKRGVNPRPKSVKTIASKVRATPGRLSGAGNASDAGCSANNPYRRIKGGYRGNGLGSLVTCRHRLSVSRQPTMLGLHTPVPGESSRAVLPPDNTAHILQKGYSKGPAPVNFLTV